VCITTQDWKRALADLDRAIQLEPRYFLSYGFRAFLDLKNKKYVRALADLALCGLTISECEFELDWHVNNFTSRFFVGVSWKLKENPVTRKSHVLASTTERRSIEQGVERLLAAALRP
jgi:hypothetical protein